MEPTLKSAIELDGFGSWQKHLPSLPDTFTADDVIEAYQIGAKDGEKNLIDRMQKQGIAHIHKAMNICESIWKFLEVEDFSPRGLHLRRDGFSSFTGLFLVDEQKYYSEGFGKAYEYTFGVSDPVNTSEYHLACLFMPYSGVFNEDLAISDGFIYTYVKS